MKTKSPKSYASVKRGNTQNNQKIYQKVQFFAKNLENFDYQKIVKSLGRVHECKERCISSRDVRKHKEMCKNKRLEKMFIVNFVWNLCDLK